MRVWVLGSGSRGNAVLVEAAGERVLVDAGFPVRTLAARFARIGVDPTSVRHCLLTHEHQDHAGGAGAAARRWGWTVHGTAGTLAASGDLADVPLVPIAPDAEHETGAWRVRAVRVSHDAVAPVAYELVAPTEARCVVAYDLGTLPADVGRVFERPDVLVVEANHDRGMLRAGPYPPSVQARIGSRTGHLDNTAAATFARDCAHAGLHHVVLSHVSERCNDPALAARVVRERLAGTRFRGMVSVAAQGTPVGPVDVAGRRGWSARAAGQLSLF